MPDQTETAADVEQRLRESESRLALLTKASSDVLYRMSPDWGEMKELDGGGFLPTTPSSHPNRSWLLAYIPESDQEAVTAAIEDAIREKKTFDLEHRVIRGDGTVGWTLSRAVPLLDNAGEIVEWFGAASNISARREIEAALRESEARLRDLNESLEQQVVERTAEFNRSWQLAQELLAITSPDGLFQNVNPMWTSVLGWKRHELIGKPFTDYVHPDDLERSLVAFGDIMARPMVIPYENRYRHKDGSYRWFGWTATFESGKVYCSGRHVTVEREQGEALRQSQKMEAVGQLTGGLAHDFNNLLTGMMGNLELLQSRVARGRIDDLDRFITAAQGAGRRAANLTQRLLAFSRRQTLDPKPTDVNRLIMGLEEMLRRTVGATADIEIVGAAGLWPAEIDAGQLENAVLNLCINARDAMPEGGRIVIETANKWIDGLTSKTRDLPPGQYISVCVTDTGVGMTPEVIARAFDPFYTTKPIGQGTGLGLSMIYGFAQQSGGQVRIYSEVGQGTTVCIYLPRHHGEADHDEFDFKAAAMESASGQTVLVVDDEATIRHLIDEVLDGLGYTVIGAADGAAGIKVLQSGARIELLITDVGLPNGMNGRQVADEARRLRPGLKVLFITGFAENAAVGNGHLEPGMELLTKPFTLEALTNKVGDMMKAVAA
ncbi:hybrid sensor histidine kinase/response regulator [Sphingomonas sp.]|uniref:hybrid sensor histidine kinase/response regulator n=1 Tax=Sphingomonas sp. TaxID=28214 RepID=UPI002FDA139C